MAPAPLRATLLRALPAALLAVVLAACAPAEQAREQAAIHGLATLLVPHGEAAAGRAWDGTVQAVQQATLTAQTSGRVAGVHKDVGDAVAAGELLLGLRAGEQQSAVDAAGAALAAAQARLDEAEAVHARHLALAEARHVSALQLDQTRATRDAARASRDGARAALAGARQQLGYTSVHAPYRGLVAARLVEPGESVAPGQPLLSVFAPDALRVEVSVPQSDAEAIRVRPVAQVRLDDGRAVDAAAVIVFPAADAATHALRIRVELPPLASPPAPGSSARVVFAATAGAAFPRIPLSALAMQGELRGAYVLSDGRVSLRQLRLGMRSGDQVEVIAGLEAGESIAADPVAARQALLAARGGD